MSEDQPRQNASAAQPDAVYAVASKRPLAILFFLLPAIAFYEFAAVAVLGEDRAGSTLTSRHLIQTLFSLFGVLGVHLPAILLLATLVAQHLIARDRWQLRLAVPGFMVVESLVWSLPLAVLAGIFGFFASDGAAAPPGVEAAAIAVGAGVYEEFVFRFVLIAAVHAVLVDACRTREAVGRWLGVAASVLAFTAYHGIATDGGIDLAAASFYGLAGLFLSWLFLARGLGIAAGAHAVYDLLVLVLIPALPAG